MAETLEEALKRLCAERGWSWRQASFRAGLNPDYLSNLFKKGHGRPKADTLRALAWAFGKDKEERDSIYGYLLFLRGLAPRTEAEQYEARILAAFRTLPPDDQERIAVMVEGLAAHRRREALESKPATEDRTEANRASPPANGLPK